MFKNVRIFSLQALVMLGLGTPCMIAQADTPFIGEVRWFAGNFAPRGWSLCDGRLLQVAQYTALFSIVGTTYGGDGRTTFAVPDLRGREMVHEGTGPGLSMQRLGTKAGTETATLTPAQVAPHTHTLRANDSGGDSALPDDRTLASVGRLPLYADAPADTDMHGSSITATGGGQPHNNMQPSIALTCIIALEGQYPPRSRSKSEAVAPITLPGARRNQ